MTKGKSGSTAQKREGCVCPKIFNKSMKLSTIDPHPNYPLGPTETQIHPGCSIHPWEFIFTKIKEMRRTFMIFLIHAPLICRLTWLMICSVIYSSLKTILGTNVIH